MCVCACVRVYVCVCVCVCEECTLYMGKQSTTSIFLPHSDGLKSVGMFPSVATDFGVRSSNVIPSGINLQNAM